MIINEIIMPRGVYERKSGEERFWLYVNKDCENGCWEWNGKSCTIDGYGRIKSGGKMIRTHRISYDLHHPLTKPIQDIKLSVLHACDNPKCVNPQHLRLGTPQENTNDMVERERHAIGEQHGSAKLTELQVLEIRERYINEKISHKKLGQEYKVGKTTISDIINRKRWTHL